MSKSIKRLDEFKPLKEYQLKLIEILNNIIYNKLENVNLESQEHQKTHALNTKIKKKKSANKNVIRLFSKVKEGEPVKYETQGYLKDLQTYHNLIKTQKSNLKFNQKLKIKNKGKYDTLNGLVIFDTNYILNLAEKEKKKAYSEFKNRPDAHFDLDFKDAKIIKGIFSI